MVITLHLRFGISADWLLFGIGSPMPNEADATIINHIATTAWSKKVNKRKKIEDVIQLES